MLAAEKIEEVGEGDSDIRQFVRGVAAFLERRLEAPTKSLP